MVVSLSMAWASDTIFNGRRWPLLVIGSSVSAAVFLALAITPVFPAHRASRWTLYYLTGLTQATSSIFWFWTQDTLLGDPATRAFASGGLNVWAYVAGATILLGLFKGVDQPGVVKGNYTAAGFAVLHSLTALTLAYLQNGRSREVTFTPDDLEETDEENTLADGVSKIGPSVDAAAL